MSLKLNVVVVGMLVAMAVAGPASAFDSAGTYGSPSGAAAGDSAPMAKARAAIAAKDWSGAIAILYKLSQSDPKSADVENLLGYSYRMLGQYSQALAYYDRALALDPMHKGALEYEGEAYLETNQLAKAEHNLATLQRACAQGCEELADLQGAVDRYKSKNKTGMN